MEKHILIDANNFMMIAMHVTNNLSKEEKDFEINFRKLFRGMLGKLRRVYGEFSQYYAVWDSKGATKWRKEQQEDYKATRTYDSHLPIAGRCARGIFDENMIPHFQYLETEADDLIHALAEVLHEDENNEVIVVTRDKDLLQVVQHGFASCVYDPSKKKNMEVPDYDIVIYKCLTGDSSDNIKGIKGIGPKRALKLMQEGVDPTLIQDNYLIVHIPSNPRYAEYIQASKSFLEETNKVYEK